MRPNSPPQMTSVSSNSPRDFRSGDQPVAGPVDVAALVGQPAGDVAVRVPIVQIDLHEPHPALDHPPRQQGRVGERARLLGLLAVQLVGRGRLAATRRSARARSTACGTPARTAGCGCAFPDRPPCCKFSSFKARRPSSVSRRTAAGTPGGLLMYRIGSPPERNDTPACSPGQIAGRPQPGRNRLHLFGVGRLGHQHDERRQVVVHRAQAVRHPRPQAGPAGDLVARLHVADGRLVVDGLGLHAADEAHVVDHLGQVRQQLADPHAALRRAGRT